MPSPSVKVKAPRSLRPGAQWNTPDGTHYVIPDDRILELPAGPSVTSAIGQGFVVVDEEPVEP